MYCPCGRKKVVHESICKVVLNVWCYTPQRKDYEVRDGTSVSKNIMLAYFHGKVYNAASQ